MGSVFRASDRQGGATVALKLLHGMNDADESRFVREARVLAELRHPAIVRHVAHGITSDGAPYLAMEWLDGESLAERLRRQELGVGEAVRLVARAAGAIGAAHRRWIIHRDLKPSNLFLPGGAVDDVKILDFGVARRGAFASELTSTGMIVGTPAYMAPEQASGSREIGPPADVWALGCVLYRCLAGRLPFVGDDLDEMISLICTAPTPRVADVPTALEELVGRMLAKDPADRPPGGEELAAELEAIDLGGLAGAPASGGSASPALTVAMRRLSCSLVVAGGADLSRLAEAHGGRAEGPGVVRFTGRASATDLALQAARAAVAIHGARGVPVAISLDGPARATALLGDGISADDPVASLIDSAFELSRDETVAARIVGERSGDAVRRLLGKPTPCVGRERELAMLDALLGEALDEPDPRAALVIGPPGVGKSRLRYELLRLVATRAPDAAIWIGRGDPMRAGSPFGLAASLLRQAIGGVPLAERVGAVIAAPEDARRVTGFLAEILGTPVADDDPQLRAARANPVLMSDQIRAAWEDFLAAAGPVVLVLEDLHWGDLPTVKLVEGTLRNLRGRPIFVVALARPEVHDLFPNLWAPHVNEIRLGELGRRACERLVKAVLAEKATPERIASIVDRAAGNAFFLEELIRAVAEGKDALPLSVLAMAQARLEALEPEARLVLSAASVYGQVFAAAGVEALLAQPPGEWLAILEDRELVARRRPAGDHVFRHALVRDAAYALLTDENRERGHRLAAAYLARTGEREPLVLAEHHERGGEPAKAAPLYRLAVEKALDGNDLRAALQHATRGLACGATGEIAGELLLGKAAASFWLGELAAAEENASAAAAALPLRGPSWYRAIGEAARTAARRSPERFDTITTTLLEPDPRPEVARPRAFALVGVIIPLLRAGRYELADRILAELGALAVDDPTTRGMILRARGYRALAHGDLAGYLGDTQEAIVEMERAGSQRDVVSYQTSVGYALLSLGRNAAAEEVLQAALAVATRRGMATVASVVKHNLGLILARLGRVDEGRRAEEEAIAEARAAGDLRVEKVSQGYLALIFLEAGDAEGAEREALAAADSDAPNRAFALAIVAEARLALGRSADALAAALEARGLLESLGGIEEGEARVRLVHAESLRATGDEAGAVAVLEAARRRLEERAAKIGDPELRASFLENVPEHARTLRS
jgi:tetratricopeptide (TPR) repeat protein